MPNGAFRNVLLVGKLAIKTPKLNNLLGGMCSNRWEREMWMKWRLLFKWTTLCPIYFADPIGLVVVMQRAIQPVQREDVDALPDYHPTITAELKPDDYGKVNGSVFALDYGLPDEEMMEERRIYYSGFLGKPAVEIPR